MENALRRAARRLEEKTLDNEIEAICLTLHPEDQMQQEPIAMGLTAEQVSPIESIDLTKHEGRTIS